MRQGVIAEYIIITKYLDKTVFSTDGRKSWSKLTAGSKSQPVIFILGLN